MSRSHRKTPIMGIATAPSEKADKQRANQVHRAAVRSRNDPEIPLRAVSDVWGFAKDGKQWMRAAWRRKWMRK